MSSILTKVRVAWAVAIVVAPLSGCGGAYETAPVRGQLTLDGKPVAGAEVLFSPIDDSSKTGRPEGQPGRASTGKVQEDGSFTLAQPGGESGALVGPHTVSFKAPPTKQPTVLREERETMTPEEIKTMEELYAAMPIYPALPPGVKISPTEVEVKSGENSFEFVLSQ